MVNKMKWFPPRMYTVLAALFAVAVLNIFLSIGQATIKPQTITVTEPVVNCQLLKSHTVQYVEKPVTVVEYIERTQKMPVELRDFSDTGELKQWLVEVGMNTTTTYFQSPGVTIDCDDYALDMQHKALADGYIMSFEIISISEYNAVFKSKLPSGQSLHAINLVIIGNDAYYIEPQTNEIGFAVHLD